jgi:hypothetical protein
LREKGLEPQYHTFFGGEIMEIRLNGESRFIDKVTKMTVAGLLEHEKVASPEMSR